MARRRQGAGVGDGCGWLLQSIEDVRKTFGDRVGRGVSISFRRSGKTAVGYKLRWSTGSGEARVSSSTSVATLDEALREGKEIQRSRREGRPYLTHAQRRPPSLEEAVQRFAEDLRALNRKQSTVSDHVSRLQQLLRFSELRTPRAPYRPRERQQPSGWTICDLHPDMLRDRVTGFWAFLEGQGLSGDYMSHVAISLRKFWSWASREWEDAPGFRVRREPQEIPSWPGSPKAPILELKDADRIVEPLLRAGLHRALCYRIFILQRAIGVRVGQAVCARKDGFDPIRGSLTYRLQKRKVRSRGEMRTVYLPPWAVAEIASWPDHGSPYLVEARERFDGSGRRSASAKRPLVGRSGSLHWLGFELEDDEGLQQDLKKRQSEVTKTMKIAAYEAGIPSQFIDRRSTHFIRRAWRTGAIKAGTEYRSHREVLSAILEFIIGHGQGVRGDYEDVSRDLEPELRAAVAQLPSPLGREQATCVGLVSVANGQVA